MAKASKSTSTKRPAAKTSKPGRKAVATAKKVKSSKPNAVETTTKATAKVATKAKVAKVAPAPKLTIGELRTQFAKLETANATLRAKNRGAGRLLKTAELRIAELEVQVSALEKKVAKSARMKPVPAAESENADD
jgi:UDP-N-acetylglucosamine:LPS N-acetylglucosamine transferase